MLSTISLSGGVGVLSLLLIADLLLVVLLLDWTDWGLSADLVLLIEVVVLVVLALDVEEEVAVGFIVGETFICFEYCKLVNNDIAWFRNVSLNFSSSLFNVNKIDT